MSRQARAVDSRADGSRSAASASSTDSDSVAATPKRVTQPLRVLFAVDSTFPGLGGAEIQALKLAHALRERGVSVEFVTPRIHATQTRTEELDGFRITRIDYPHIRLIGSFILLVRFAVFLMRNRHRFDSVHVHVTRLLSATAGAIRPFSKLPVVTKISGFFEFEGGVLDQRKRFLPVNFMLRRALKNVDYVQTISEQTRDKLLDAGFSDQQIRFIPNGIDTRGRAAFPSARDVSSDRFTLGYCGRLREVKGVHVLIDGFADAQSRLPDVDLCLKIAGDGEAEAALRTQVARLGIESRVEFVGRIDDTEQFLRDLDLYVQPSFAEGLPNSVLEAMLAGRTVLATRIGGNTDLVVDGVTGYLFPAGDADTLSALIEQCVAHPDQLDSLGGHGRDVIISEYGFDRVADELMNLYSRRPAKATQPT